MSTEQFIDKGDLKWDYISKISSLDKELIEKDPNSLDWSYISKKQVLEDLIERNNSSSDWSYISKHQDII